MKQNMGLLRWEIAVSQIYFRVLVVEKGPKMQYTCTVFACDLKILRIRTRK